LPLFCWSLFATETCATETATLEVKQQQLAKHTLVRGVVESIAEKKPLNIVTFVIDEVYVGDTCRKGDKFTAEVSRGSGGQSMVHSIAFNPSLVVGDKVLWSVRAPGEHKTSTSSGGTVLGLTTYTGGVYIRFPIPLNLKVKAKGVDWHVSLAMEARKTLQLSPGKRWGYLQRLCRNESVPVACWAMTVMANAHPEEAKSVFAEVVSTKPETDIVSTIARQQIDYIERGRPE